MYIENAYRGKSPKWLYIICPTLFFGLTGLSFLALSVVDTSELIKISIEKKGELRFFAENLASFAFFCIALLLWVRYVHQQPLLHFHTSRSKVDWKRFFFSFFLWGGIIIAVTFINYMVYPQDFEWNFQLEPFLILCAISILLIPFQAGFEEYFFRGYLIQSIGIFVKNRWFPLLFTSVTFGLVHAANPEVFKLGYWLLAYYIGTGFFLGIIVLMDEGLELALGFHIANNLFSAILMTSNWSVFQTPSLLKDVSEPSLIATMLFPLLFYFPLMLFIFSKKYSWNNWKEKLFGRVLSEKEFLENQQ
ncbi:CPBP family intramembrane glutamic endopeptidase [Capnocytophaga cynodegmi]|uniref:CPBP family intramembrane glutamic endopeptidase n=1 Tax=Capnocytophaga cynodegmi TaxID=28189 RepID=UPI00385CBBAF